MALRLLHTSDWHLGRALHEEPLLEDQAWVLDRLVALAREERPDAVVIAGDVFDRAVPPSDAVRLLDDVLTRLADLGLPVVAIAGNHDSADRLGFGARLLEARGVHLRGDLARAAEPVVIPGKGRLYALPFVDPEVVRGLEADEALRGSAAATARVLERLRAAAAAGAGDALPAVLVAHAFVQGGRETPDSERPLSVGGAGAVPAEALAGFDYVALGHLHAPQDLGGGLRYSGSLLRYSFSEAGQAKSVSLVEVERGTARVREVALGAKREVVRLSGTLHDLLTRPEHAPHARALVEVTLEDEGYVFDARARLQERFAHVLNVVRRELTAGAADTFARKVDGAGGDDLKLFDAFFEAVASGPPTPEQRDAFAEALAAVARQERAA